MYLSGEITGLEIERLQEQLNPAWEIVGVYWPKKETSEA